MKEFRCPFCNHFIGKEVQGRLYNNKNVVIADSSLQGHCVKCRSLVIWNADGTVPEVMGGQLPLHTPPNPATGEPAKLIENTGDIVAPVPSTPITPPVYVDSTIPVIPQPPHTPSLIYVRFGNSKVYHTVDHYEGKVGTVIEDITDMKLCTVCEKLMKELL